MEQMSNASSQYNPYILVKRRCFCWSDRIALPYLHEKDDRMMLFSVQVIIYLFEDGTATE
jgi:hypothetical protein